MKIEELKQKVRGQQISLLEFADMAAKVEDNATLANLAKTLNYVADKLVDEVEEEQIPISFI